LIKVIKDNEMYHSKLAHLKRLNTENEKESNRK